MPQPNVYLDNRQRQALAEVAAVAQMTIEDALSQAVADYLERRQHDEIARATRFERLVDRLIQQVPTDVSDAEIDADIDAAIAEVRQARRDARRS
jgi:hypothetical protein